MEDFERKRDAKAQLDGDNRIYQIRVDLDGAHPPIWRRLLIPVDYTLDWVHETLQVAMGWWGEHLHMFTGQDVSICPRDYEFTDTLHEDTMTLAYLLPEVGSTAKYEYDFGDGWVHTLRLEAILSADPEEVYPLCLKGRRACPPEDVGGMPGYENFLTVLANPRHPEHQDVVAWLGDEDFAPERFESAEVNAELRDLGLAAAGESAELIPHNITILRQEMLSPDMLGAIGAIYNPIEMEADEVARQERLIRRSRGASKLLGLLPELHPSLFDLWSERICGATPDVGSLVVDSLTAGLPSEGLGRGRAIWAWERLVVLLYRAAPEPVAVLMDAWDALDEEARSLACIVFGLRDARETLDLVRRHCRVMLAIGGYEAAMGPLWALADFQDPMVVDVLVDALEAGDMFPELWPMLSRAGDERAVMPLVDRMITAPEDWQWDFQQAIACVAHRIGRPAFIDTVTSGLELAMDDSQEQIEAFAEMVFATPEDDAKAYFAHHYEETTLEEIMAELQGSWDAGLDEDGLMWDDDAMFGDVLTDDYVYDESLFDRALSAPDVAFSRETGQPVRREFVPPGRNDPCWCGSGRKYKQCHWQSDQRDKLGRVETA